MLVGMERHNTLDELNALSRRVQEEIASKLEDFDERAKAELARLQLYYDARKRELEARKAGSLLDGWQDREWWRD